LLLTLYFKRKLVFLKLTLGLPFFPFLGGLTKGFLGVVNFFTRETLAKVRGVFKELILLGEVPKANLGVFKGTF